MSDIQRELGKLMAFVEAQQKQLSEIKKEVSLTKSQITDVHTELLNFMALVQTKKTCSALHDRLNQNFIGRAELAPFKAVLNVVALTTATTICVAFLNLILK